MLAQLRKYGLPHDTAIFTHVTPYGAYTWNVSAALAVVQARPRQAHPVHPPLCNDPRDGGRGPGGGSHGGPRQPGITAPYFDLSTHCWTEVVIDGNHRAVRSHQTGYPFQCYALTVVESFVLLLAHPYVWESLYYAPHLLGDEGWLHRASASAPSPPQVRTRRPVFRAPTRRSRPAQALAAVAQGGLHLALEGLPHAELLPPPRQDCLIAQELNPGLHKDSRKNGHNLSECCNGVVFGLCQP